MVRDDVTEREVARFDLADLRTGRGFSSGLTKCLVRTVEGDLVLQCDEQRMFLRVNCAGHGPDDPVKVVTGALPISLHCQ